MRRRGAETYEQEPEQKEARVQDSVQQPAGSHSHNELTVIGAGARLEGNLISAASLRIEGAVKGHVTADGDVIVAPQAEVAADIRASNVTIAGKYTGNITANGNLELASTARVEGNVSCCSLIVNQGAVFSGQSMMGGESPMNALQLDAEMAGEE